MNIEWNICISTHTHVYIYIHTHLFSIFVDWPMSMHIFLQMQYDIFKSTCDFLCVHVSLYGNPVPHNVREKKLMQLSCLLILIVYVGIFNLLVPPANRSIHEPEFYQLSRTPGIFYLVAPHYTTFSPIHSVINISGNTNIYRYSLNCDFIL